MISDIIETLAILKEKGFEKEEALQMMIIDKLDYIGGKLNELSHKG